MGKQRFCQPLYVFMVYIHCFLLQGYGPTGFLTLTFAVPVISIPMFFPGVSCRKERSGSRSIETGEESVLDKGKKVLVAMSGGVDSSVAAYLLREEGFKVEGVTMNLGVAGPGGEGARRCGAEAADEAGRVCESLGIPHRVIDYAGALKEKVIDPFIDEYRKGRTPNPCVRCNRFLKFGILLEKAQVLGFDFLATGHYAKIEQRDGLFFLKRPRDRRKDQTYFLYAIPRRVLGSILFPLASFTKEEVRETARRAGLPVAGREESQDICFIPRKNQGAFLTEHVRGIKPGPITDRTGKKLGEHRGIVFYTIGQRGGLGISAKSPLYVVSIDVPENRIVVGEKKDVVARGLLAGDLNMLAGDWPPTVYGKVRYRKKEAPCSAVEQGGRLRVVFEEEQEAVTSGQSVVLYDGDIVLGGGVIEEVFR
jgi:tRNA-specific 2-thiouridylase